MLCCHILGSSRKLCRPFIIDGNIIGSVPPYVYQELQNYKKVFSVTGDSISLHESINTPIERTNKINHVLENLYDQNIFCALKGWRNEVNSGIN